MGAVSFKVFCDRYNLDSKATSSKAEYETYKSNLDLFTQAASKAGVVSEPVKRVTVSLPPDVLSMLDDTAKLLGLSRSAFLSGFLRESMPTALNMAKAAHEVLAGDSVSRRYRDSSRSDIDDLIRKLSGEIQSDLFK